MIFYGKNSKIYDQLILKSIASEIFNNVCRKGSKTETTKMSKIK